MSYTGVSSQGEELNHKFKRNDEVNSTETQIFT